MQVAPRTYRNWKRAAPSARTVTGLTDVLRATIGTAEGIARAIGSRRALWIG
jgi:putative transposase